MPDGRPSIYYRYICKNILAAQAEMFRILLENLYSRRNTKEKVEKSPSPPNKLKNLNQAGHKLSCTKILGSTAAWQISADQRVASAQCGADRHQRLGFDFSFKW
jgi:hypothetical protein